MTHLSKISQLDSDEEEIRDAAAQIESKKAYIKKLSQAKNTLKKRPVMPRRDRHQTLKEFTTGMRKIGLDPRQLERRAEGLVSKKREEWESKGGEEGEGMDVDMEGEDGDAGEGSSSRVTRSGGVSSRLPRTNRALAGLATTAVSPFFFIRRLAKTCSGRSATESYSFVLHLSLQPHSNPRKLVNFVNSLQENRIDSLVHRNPIGMYLSPDRCGCSKERERVERRIGGREWERSACSLSVVVAYSGFLMTIALDTFVFWKSMDRRFSGRGDALDLWQNEVAEDTSL